MTHLASLVGPSDGLQHPLARLGVIDEGIALGPVDELEMLGAGLPEHGFGRHTVEISLWSILDSSCTCLPEVARFQAEYAEAKVIFKGDIQG